MEKSKQMYSSYVHVNDVDFYYEQRGQGPTIVLVPSGEGDCASYENLAAELANEFTVLTMDMRGCSRSGRPPEWNPITPSILASDLAGIISELNLAPATVYGCSSGGQAALALGLEHRNLVRNLVIHEAALLLDAPETNSDYSEEAKSMVDFFCAAIQKLVNIKGSRAEAFYTLLESMTGQPKAFELLGPEYIERIKANADVWMDLYVPSAALKSYSKKELASMPPVVFSAGMLSPAWIAESNKSTAIRGNAEFIWLPPPSTHFPQLTNALWLAQHIRRYTNRYI